MDALVQQSLESVRATARTKVPWEPDEPWHQSFHTYRDGGWKTRSPQGQKPSTQDTFTSVALYSWNIDSMLPYAGSRMTQAIRHLEELITAQPHSIATIIYLQETVESDLTILASNPWVRRTFHLTDLSPQTGHPATTAPSP